MARRTDGAGPIRVGIAGLGRAGYGMHLNELRSRGGKFEIVVACDPARDRRERMAEACGCRTVAGIEELIADPEVELVDVATRTTDHVPHALLALAAGKQVFLEKPIAVTYTEARKLVPAAAASKGNLYVRHNRRFETAFQHIREIIASRILGDVFEIKLRRNSYGRRDDWQTLIPCGGGQLRNWGPHIIDHALRFLESPVADVWSDLRRVAAVGDAEDHLKIVLKGQNGRVVDLEISGGAAVGEPEYIVLGKKGGLTCSGNEISLRYLDPKKKLPQLRAKSGNPNEGFGSADPLRWVEKTITARPRLRCKPDDIWDYLYAAIREGERFPITLDEALEVMRIISLTKKGTPFAP